MVGWLSAVQLEKSRSDLGRNEKRAMSGAEVEVVFLATPAIGNLVPAVEFAQRLANHDPRFCSTVLVITDPHRPLVSSYIHSRAAASSSSSSRAGNLRFVHLPQADPPRPSEYQSAFAYASLHIANHAPLVKQALVNLRSTGTRVAALFLDMFTVPVADVACELGIPHYLFFASPASFLGFMLYLLDPGARKAIESEDMSTELPIPSFVNSVPKRVLPSLVLRWKDAFTWFLAHAGRYGGTKGIVINTFAELEGHALQSLRAGALPPVYSVGPVIDLDGPVKWHPQRAKQEAIVRWLDKQPPSSVVFLCFGSMGSLGAPQAREIASGLERSGFRFLWSLREPPRSKLDIPGDYESMDQALPEAFLDRTAETGLVCGWVPQVTVLAHKAIGGFVSHCGWNSILESLWSGVPMATWPIYAEQQMNAFQMVAELGLAVEIRLDYREGSTLVSAEELERGLRCLMGSDGSSSKVRSRVKEMRDKSRTAATEYGSSHASMRRLVQQLVVELEFA
ncbi:UDP-glycosyltransferase 43-like isoform X1 [Rhodamnia argentea]|uniref:Glycosyltransferase n=1 Tax=Rhodamnia argentea TaxID=178133 RepID=A0ABM3H534_9MYRT|nr:UDP-glycosyltransferase 43-like isoform X1 [Rhodamnia argentea]